MEILARPRRLRNSAGIREMVAETVLRPEQLVWPIFLTEGNHLQESIKTMPGVYRWSLDAVLPQIRVALDHGVQAVALFPKIKESKKDSQAQESLNPEGLIPSALKLLKKEFPSLQLISDIALDPFNSDGHDGLLKNGRVANDESVEQLVKMALLHARAGADFVAPSDMMDGRVGAIRRALEKENPDIGIISYAAKYASVFYGPFRDALDSAPKAGDKKSYQMDPRNVREALREVRMDVEEGADIVMVKPAGAYLDIIQAVKREVQIPVAAYQVSGEYSMIRFGAEHGLFQVEQAMSESLMAIRRAGADLIFTYFAVEMAKKLKTGIGST